MVRIIIWMLLLITAWERITEILKFDMIILTWMTSRFSVIMNLLLLRHLIVQIMIIFIIKRRNCLLPDRRMFTSVLCRQQKKEKLLFSTGEAATLLRKCWENFWCLSAKPAQKKRKRQWSVLTGPRQSSTSSIQIWTCRKVLRWKMQMKGKRIKTIKELRDAVREDSKRKTGNDKEW